MNIIIKLKTLCLLISVVSLPLVFAVAETPVHQHADGPHQHQAEHAPDLEHDTGEQLCQDVIQIEVTGLVCDFCARALEKVFSKRDEVKDIKVDLAAGLVTVALKAQQTISEKTLRELITDSGYNINQIIGGCNDAA